MSPLAGRRAPRCLGCLNFTGFSPQGLSDDFFCDPERQEEHVPTCLAFPTGIPADILSHRRPHYRPESGQEGAHVFRPRAAATLSCAEAAAQVGCSASTLRGYLRSGLLWGVKEGRVWRVSRDEVRLLRRPGHRGGIVPPGFLMPAVE